jgi:hypothetical protein
VRNVVLAGLLLATLLAFSGCTRPATTGSDGQILAPDGRGPLMTFEQAFESTTLRGSLALRLQIEPKTGETCLFKAEGTVVRPIGRFSIFFVSEKADGTKIASPYGYVVSPFAATVAGVKSSSVTDPPAPEKFRFTAKFNETRVRTLTLYFEDIDASKGAFRATLQCPTEPARIELAGSRQALLVEQTRSAAATLEAEMCPDFTAGVSGVETTHLDGPMRFWLTSTEAVGFVELTGPSVSKTWDLREAHAAETLEGGPGDYRISLHRASVDQGAALDYLAAGIGSFPRINSLEDLKQPNAPRQAVFDSALCAHS